MKKIPEIQAFRFGNFLVAHAEFPNSNVATKRYDKRYDNRTATCNGSFSLALDAAPCTLWGDLLVSIFVCSSYNIGQFITLKLTRNSLYTSNNDLCESNK